MYWRAYSGASVPGNNLASPIGFPRPSPTARLQPRLETSNLPRHQSAVPVRTFAENSSIGTRSTDVALSSRSLGWRESSQRPGRMCSDKTRRAASFSCRIVHQCCLAQDYHRAVVHRVIENERASTRPSSNVTVMHTGTPSFHLAQHATGGRAVNVEAGVLCDRTKSGSRTADPRRRSRRGREILHRGCGRRIRDRRPRDRLRGPHESAQLAFGFQTLGN